MLRILRCAVWLAVAACATSAPPLPPAPLGSASQIVGRAGLPREPRRGPAAIAGTVTLLDTGGMTDNTQHWRFEITSATNERAVYLVDLPAAMTMPFVQGDRLEVASDTEGGGPNERTRLVIVDDRGGLRVAFHRVPAAWKVDFGTAGTLRQDDSYDERAYRVRVQSPSGAAAELDNTWRIVELDGVRYHGKGSAAKRKLKSRIRPPDYVGQWIDFALVAKDASTTPTEEAP